MKVRFRIAVAVFVAALLASTHAFAQGGGASTTGSINGKVADIERRRAARRHGYGDQPVGDGRADLGHRRWRQLPVSRRFRRAHADSVLPSCPASTRSSAKTFGSRWASPPTVNVELAVASLQETVTVTGDSPVIDTSSTRVQQNFKLEALQEIPNSRDLWSLLAVTPSVTMGRIDVGGNRAGTQTGYTAYGYSGQNRVLVEGHQHDGRHGGRRLLRRLRIVRGGLPRDDRAGRRDADAGRAEPDARQVGRQQVPGRAVSGLRNATG